MRACSVSAAVLLFAVYVSAYLVDPDTTASPDTIEDCSYWVVVSSSDTCDSIESDWGVTSEQFLTYVRVYIFLFAIDGMIYHMNPQLTKTRIHRWEQDAR